jgi:hypothetical protein
MALSFPDRPATTLPDLQRNVLELVQQLKDGATAVLITGVLVGTTETRISHGQMGVPKAVLVCPHGAIAAGRGPTAPDSSYIYLIAASGCTADLVVFL